MDAAATLKAVLYVRLPYDISGAYAIGFEWSGAGNAETNTFHIQTPTGSLIAPFPDGPSELRLVYLPLSQFGVTSGGETPPDLTNVSGFFWSVTAPGERKLGRIFIYEAPALKAKLTVARPRSVSLKAALTVYNPGG